MIVFNGYQFAASKEAELKPQVQQLLMQGKKPAIAAVLFAEDAGSRLYTRLKQEAAGRILVEYSVNTFSMTEPVEKVISRIHALNQDHHVTGIIVQKPWRQRWVEVTGQSSVEFETWWHELVSALDINKDVDGLHPVTLAAIQQGDWRQKRLVMPATAKAVLDILSVADRQLRVEGQRGLSPEVPITILGKSDILGQPLYYELLSQGYDVEMVGSRELTEKIEQGIGLRDRGVVISATGRSKLITGDLLAPGSVVVDVGEPKPDVEFESVSKVASFMTPVPGGVGPVTVVSLLENAVELVAPRWA